MHVVLPFLFQLWRQVHVHSLKLCLSYADARLQWRQSVVSICLSKTWYVPIQVIVIRYLRLMHTVEKIWNDSQIGAQWQPNSCTATAKQLSGDSQTAAVHSIFRSTLHAILKRADLLSWHLTPHFNFCSALIKRNYIGWNFFRSLAYIYHGQ